MGMRPRCQEESRTLQQLEAPAAATSYRLEHAAGGHPKRTDSGSSALGSRSPSPSTRGSKRTSPARPARSASPHGQCQLFVARLHPGSHQMKPALKAAAALSAPVELGIGVFPCQRHLLPEQTELLAEGISPLAADPVTQQVVAPSA